jgi:hypothetical protein
MIRHRHPCPHEVDFDLADGETGESRGVLWIVRVRSKGVGEVRVTVKLRSRREADGRYRL